MSKIKNCRDIFHFEFTRSLVILNRPYFIPEHQKNTLTFVLHLRMFAGIELIFVYTYYLIVPCVSITRLCVLVCKVVRMLAQGYFRKSSNFRSLISRHCLLCKLLRILDRLKLIRKSYPPTSTVSFSTYL